MFDDRTSSFASVQEIGHEIIDAQPDAESANKTKLDLEKVTELWNSLFTNVVERKNFMDEALPLSLDFNDKLNSANKLINDLEEKVAAEKWTPHGTKVQIQKQIDEFAVSF